MNREYVLEFNTLMLLESMRHHSLGRMVHTVMLTKFDEYTKHRWDESYSITQFRFGVTQIIVKLQNGRPFTDKPEVSPPGIYDHPEYRCDPFSALVQSFELVKKEI